MPQSGIKHKGCLARARKVGITRSTQRALMPQSGIKHKGCLAGARKVGITRNTQHASVAGK